MTRTLRTLMALLLVLSMCLITPAFAEEKPTLTVFFEEVVTIEDLETNAAVLWLEEQIGCNLEFIVAPTGSAEEKMNILLNSGDYPDVFYMSVPNENLYGVESGILLDLTPYIEDKEMMPNFNQFLEYRPNIRNQIKAVDGKTYYLPDYNETLHVLYANKMFCNKGILDELGLGIPTTTDEFYDAMVAFKAAYPDGIGYATCTDGNSSPWSFLTNAWTYSTLGISKSRATSTLGLRNHNGVVESIIDDEEYREALRYLNKLYAEGLLYEGSFTMDGAQLKALLASETPVLFWSGMHNVMYVDAAATPELYANEKPVAPLVGPNGAQYTTYCVANPNPGFAISSTCKNIEAAIKLGDIHYSSLGYWMTNEGREGIEWRHANEGEVTTNVNIPAFAKRNGAYIDGIQNVKLEPRALRAQILEVTGGVTDWEGYDENVAAPWGSYFRSKMTIELYQPLYQEEYQTIPNQKFTIDEEEEMNMYVVSLQNYVAETRVAFITGAKSLDTDWDAYVASLESMGLGTVIELYQTAIDRTA